MKPRFTDHHGGCCKTAIRVRIPDERHPVSGGQPGRRLRAGRRLDRRRVSKVNKLLGAVVVSPHRERVVSDADDRSDAAGTTAGIVGRPRRAGAPDNRGRSNDQTDEQPHAAIEAGAVLPGSMAFSIRRRYDATQQRRLRTLLVEDEPTSRTPSSAEPSACRHDRRPSTKRPLLCQVAPKSHGHQRRDNLIPR